MIILDTKVLIRERDKLKLTARDLNEFDDPLDNLLRDVMFGSVYGPGRKKGLAAGSGNNKLR